MTLTLINTQTTDITNLNVSLSFIDRISSSLVSNRFTITNTTITGLSSSSTLSSLQTATIVWQVNSLLSSQASIDTINVGGTVSYVQNSKTYNITIFEDIVVNYPSPNLEIHYFIPQVFNSSYPVPMGLVVLNSGNGQVIDISVDTVKALMIDNTFGVKVKYQILEGIVFGNTYSKETQATYNVVMGNSTTTVHSGAIWYLLPQVDSKFTSFSTSQKHIDPIGNTRPSGIQYI